MIHNLKLGKRAPRRDYRTLRLARYLRPALPTPPPAVDWSGPVAAQGGYGMLLNDRLGDCVIAGMLHLAMQQADNVGSPLTPSDADALTAYEAIGGYSPADPSTDEGCVMLDALNAWRTNGIIINGKLHKIGAFASVNWHNPVELQAAHWLFGGVLFGLDLPAAVQDANEWADPPNLNGDNTPGSWGGHCVLSCAFSSGWQFGTWGDLMPVTPGFIAAYADEAYAVISPDWFLPSGECPDGFDVAQLQADLAVL
jgi:hypothetical protein